MSDRELEFIDQLGEEIGTVNRSQTIRFCIDLMKYRRLNCEQHGKDAKKQLKGKGVPKRPGF